MSIETKIYLVILGMWVVNYIPRLLPMVVLSKLHLPKAVVDWLGFIPAAVLAAIVVPSIFMPEHQIDLSFTNNNLMAAIPAFVVALKTKSLVWTLLAGMAVMALLTV